MEWNKAPGLDDFPTEFCQVFWEVIKKDLMALFNDFYEKHLPLFSINFRAFYLRLKMQNRSNNTDQSVFLVSSLKFSQSWHK
jgi:hypothetical protein